MCLHTLHFSAILRKITGVYHIWNRVTPSNLIFPGFLSHGSKTFRDLKDLTSVLELYYYDIRVLQRTEVSVEEGQASISTIRSQARAMRHAL